MTRILFYLDGYPHDAWRHAVQAAIPGVDFRGNPDWGNPEDGPAYAFVWEPEPGLLARYPNIKAIFSLGAGIDHLMRDPDLPRNVPVIRMGDDALHEGMREYLTMATLMFHRQLPQLIAAQRHGKWGRVFSPAASHVRVGIMGYGTLGHVVADSLSAFGYQISGWTRRERAPEPGRTLYHGDEGLRPFLRASDILLCLLPETPETKGLLEAETLAELPKGAAIVNAGRGGLVVLEDLIAALDSGHLAGAMLDVFPVEPLPVDHPAWEHEKIIITPHVAAITRPHTAAEYVARNIARIERGERPENLLDLDTGY
ncbi:2-hydroxyacid dehydrogenase [Gimibacter soli]|uniref:Glyoxylate/hydroxypyruvate reductase A n=1 Tax=Gimibacter soli TaxID=3024400 RepID=A0AAE9XSF4_9PROT|nr:glyoxylate/hydroxypyruvate reductase A [Gimibacter soli]WCL55466.1 glyoxylate/hydroxypyruvate reductase A [Gimibacter soli]